MIDIRKNIKFLPDASLIQLQILGPHYEIIELSGGLRIFIGFEKMNLEGAIHYCNNRGGRVYEPRDAQQRDQVEQKSYEAQLLHGYWLGITDMEEEGVYVFYNFIVEF